VTPSLAVEVQAGLGVACEAPSATTVSFPAAGARRGCRSVVGGIDLRLADVEEAQRLPATFRPLRRTSRLEVRDAPRGWAGQERQGGRIVYGGRKAARTMAGVREGTWFLAPQSADRTHFRIAQAA
jgi:hypothetical protein